MASEGTNRTLWHLAIFGAVVFLLIKAWPAIRALFAGGGSVTAISGGGGGGGAYGSPQPGQGSIPRQGSQSLGGSGFNNSSVQSNSNPLTALASFLNGVKTQDAANANKLSVDNSPLAAVDNAGISLQATSNLDDLPAYDEDELNDGALSEEEMVGSDDSGNDVDSYAPIDNGGDYFGGDPYAPGEGPDGSGGYDPGQGGGEPD